MQFSCFGGIPIDLTQCPIDFLIGTPNKCLEGLPGISFVICKKSSLEKTKDDARTYYLNLHAEALAYEQTGGMRFTPPVQIMYSLKQALKELISEGVERRCARYKRNSELLLQGLEKIGFKFFTDPLNRSPIVTNILYPNHTNFHFEKLCDRLYEKGFTIYPGKKLSKKVFQIANIGDITKKDILNFLNELETILIDMNCDLQSQRYIHK
jgi:aspartate aminotransferase-like enzyme